MRRRGVNTTQLSPQSSRTEFSQHNGRLTVMKQDMFVFKIHHWLLCCFFPANPAPFSRPTNFHSYFLTVIFIWDFFLSLAVVKHSSKGKMSLTIFT